MNDGDDDDDDNDVIENLAKTPSSKNSGLNKTLSTSKKSSVEESPRATYLDDISNQNEPFSVGGKGSSLASSESVNRGETTPKNHKTSKSLNFDSESSCDETLDLKSNLKT